LVSLTEAKYFVKGARHKMTSLTMPSEVPASPAAPTLRLVKPGSTAPSARAESLCRRLRLALYDLGLTDVVGGDWISADEEGIDFLPLHLRRADRLACHLEDLARSSPVRDPHASSARSERYEQLTLF
jgi:hypothetical protein